MGAKFRPVDRGDSNVRVVESRAVHMSPEQIVGGLTIIREAYKRNARPGAPARQRTIEAAIEYIERSETWRDAIERGTKSLLLQAAEQVGEMQQRVIETRTIRRY